MKRSRYLLLVLGLALAIFASACGGGSEDVPDGAVAVVDGTEVSRAELDELVERAKKAYAAGKQEFPKVGTPEFQNIQTQYVTFLVQREEFEKEADELGITVTDADVDKEVDEFLKTRFAGKRDAFEKALKEQGFTEEALRDTLRTSVLSQKLFDAVTKDVKVDDAEILAYYQQNQAQYGTPESRDVRHILISEKKSGDEVDFPKSKVEADRIYRELQDGGDFTTLAKANSDDPSVKDNGGKLTITRGQTVPEFDKVAFELEQGALSQAGEDHVRLPRHRGAHAGEESHHDAHCEGSRVDSHHAAPGEEDDVHDDVGRGSDGQVRRQGQLRSRLRAPRGPGRDDDRDRDRPELAGLARRARDPFDRAEPRARRDVKSSAPLRSNV